MLEEVQFKHVESKVYEKIVLGNKVNLNREKGHELNK